MKRRICIYYLERTHTYTHSSTHTNEVCVGLYTSILRLVMGLGLLDMDYIIRLIQYTF